jgi:hypothetical protein
MFVPGYTEPQLREAVASSSNLSETLRRVGLRAAGGNHALLKKWIARWGIDTSHFDPNPARRPPGGRTRIPLERALVEGSDYTRGTLKRRLFEEGIKPRECELCGQGETWRGKRMGLILDHINGVWNDNRLENLRIACPNCAATFDTHCGRKNRLDWRRVCERCGEPFDARTRTQRYCSRECGQRGDRGRPKPGLRRVERPPYARLLAEVAELGWSAVGRRYGVSDNAVRKWMRWYEAEVDERAA